MLWKSIIVLSCASIIFGGIVWVNDGFVIFPHDREEVRTTVTDPLFGTTKEEITWRSIEPKYGLLPQGTNVADIPRSYVFILGASSVCILLGLIIRKRQRTQTA